MTPGDDRTSNHPEENASVLAESISRARVRLMWNPKHSESIFEGLKDDFAFYFASGIVGHSKFSTSHRIFYDPENENLKKQANYSSVYLSNMSIDNVYDRVNIVLNAINIDSEDLSDGGKKFSADIRGVWEHVKSGVREWRRVFKDFPPEWPSLRYLDEEFQWHQDKAADEQNKVRSALDNALDSVQAELDAREAEGLGDQPLSMHDALSGKRKRRRLVGRENSAIAVSSEQAPKGRSPRSGRAEILARHSTGSDRDPTD